MDEFALLQPRVPYLSIIVIYSVRILIGFLTILNDSQRFAMETGQINTGSSRGRDNETGHRKAPVAAMFEDCLQSFERVCEIVKNNQGADIPGYAIIDGSLGRFRQWGYDTGAPKRLLDHSLRKAPHLQRATTDLLEDLLSGLQTGTKNAPLLGKLLLCRTEL